MESPTDVLVRPRLRGRMHQVAVLVSIAGLIWIVSVAPTGRARAAAWIYGIAGVLLYLTSSSYHVFARSPAAARKVMQRIDHSMIFVLIVGTFTPVAVLAVHDPWRWPALVIMWAGALFGIGLKIFGFTKFRRLGGAMYIILGWTGALAFPELLHRPGVLALVVGGGLLYTLGALLFAKQVPNWSPGWFGYHEVWHTFGVAAGALLFAANLGLVRGG